MLTSDEPIAVASRDLSARAGLAFPSAAGSSRGRVGAERLGFFSTGVARERITVWRPARLLAFEVLDQPPAMEEMSPYRRSMHRTCMAISTRGKRASSSTPLPGGRTAPAPSRRLACPAPRPRPLLGADRALGGRAVYRRVLRDTSNKAEALAGRT